MTKKRVEPLSGSGTPGATTGFGTHTVAPPIRDRIVAGDVLAGTFVQTPHPVVCEFLGRHGGLDLLCLEAEHSAMGAETIQSMIVAGDATGVPSLVRLENNEWVPVARALDAGAQGVIGPRVNNRTEAEALVRAARYPPSGDRGIGPGRATAYGPAGGADYRAWANEHLLIGAQVETRAALDQLDGILSVTGLDLIFVGPMDLGSSLGIPPNTPELEAVIADVVARALAAGRACGIFATTAAQAAHWVEHGVQLVLLASDLIFMAKGVGIELAAFRQQAPGRRPSSDDGAGGRRHTTREETI